MFAASALLLLALAANAQKVLFEGSGLGATFYYENDNDHLCDAIGGGPNWSASQMDGATFCNDNTDATKLVDFHTNRIVAFNANMMGDKSLCGKEVQIFDSTGKQITIDEGPLFIWDKCPGCTDGHVDLSAKAFVAARGDGVCGDNPTGLTIKVLDTTYDPHSLGSGGSAAGGSGATADTAAAQVPASTTPAAATPAVTTSAAPSVAAATSTASIRGTGAWWAASSAAPAAATTSAEIPNGVLVAVPSDVPAATEESVAVPAASAAADAAAGTSCVYGKWSCAGKTIQVCSYITTSTLGWTDIGACDNECSVSASGSIICQ